MSTERQKEAARRNLRKARAAPRKRSKSKSASGDSLSTAERNDMPDSAFAFPESRKEPIVDAAHVRNAIARFDQVEDVTDAQRDKAWSRILRAARKFDVEVEAQDWRELFKSGKAKKR